MKRVKRTTGAFFALIVMAVILFGGCRATEPTENPTPQTPDEIQSEDYSENPGLTVTEDELLVFFKEIFIEGEIYDAIRFIRGENTPITDENGELIIIGQDEYEYEFDWYYKIEPKYSIEKLREMCQKYFSDDYFIRINAGIDYNFRVENNELFFSMNDTIVQDSGEYNIDSFKIIERNELSVVCQIEVLHWDVIITEYVFTYEDGIWKLSNEYFADTDESVLPAPEPLNLEKDFIYLNITPEEADELFGEPLSFDENDYSANYTMYYRTYEDVDCVFKVNENGDMCLINIRICSGEYEPFKGIKIGASFETVLSQIELGENDSITSDIMIHRDVINYDTKIRTNSDEVYRGKIIMFSNSDDFYNIKGTLTIYIDEDINEIEVISVYLDI